MKLSRYIPALLVSAGLSLTACSHRQPAAPQVITPLYAMIDSVNSMDSLQRVALMQRDSLELTAFFQVLGCDTLSYSELIAWSHSLPVAIFTPDVDSIFPSLAPLEATLGEILANARRDSLDLPDRSYAAVVWGNRRSIVFNGSVMLIALNHYLGSEYSGYSHFPAYTALDKTPERLPYDLAEALVANRWPYQGSDHSTVLSRLIYEGVITYAKLRLVPQSDITQALGYNRRQLEWLDNHEAEIWQKIVADKLLYDTSADIASRLVDPAPNTSLISIYTPGRVGRYIGYRIVCRLIDSNAKLTLAEMLRPDFYDAPDILDRAKYNP